MEQTLIVSEIMPNPKGKDSGNEWIEITNISDKEINLENFKLDDGENGSKPYSIPKIILQGKTSIVFRQPTTKINLNNSNDEARLIKSNGEIADSIKYTTTKDGQSISKIELKTQKSSKWTIMATTSSEGLPSKPMYIITGEIIRKISDNKFIMSPENTKSTIEITTPKENQATQSLIFNEKQFIKILAEKISEKNFSVIDYKKETIQQPIPKTSIKKDSDQIRTTTLISIILLITLVIILAKIKKR